MGPACPFGHGSPLGPVGLTSSRLHLNSWDNKYGRVELIQCDWAWGGGGEKCSETSRWNGAEVISEAFDEDWLR